MNDHEKTIHQIENDMARSRAEIERTTEELKAKMSPETLADAARQVIIEGTEKVEENVKKLADTAGDHVESLGSQALDYFQRNPLPALIAGLGVGLLISIAEKDVTQAQAPATPSTLNTLLAENPKLMRMQRRTARNARRVNRQHPLILGAAVFGVGLLLGSLLPNTQREHELMGPARDQLLESGKEAALQAVNQAKEVVSEEVDKLKAESSEIKESVEDAALAAFHEARLEREQQHSSPELI